MSKKQVDVKNSEVVKRDDYSDVLKKIIRQGHCPFCEDQLFLHHREPLLFKTKYWLATKNSWPYAGTKHHVLLITREHVERGEDLSPAAWKDLQLVYKKLNSLFKNPAATLLMRSGDMRYTGATVRHLHAQYLITQKRTPKSEPIRAVVGFKK